MTEHKLSNWAENDDHPPEDELRLYADGELEPPDSARLKTHLESCWSCRVKFDELQETIADFINYRNQVLHPLLAPPPGDWRGFAARLKQMSNPPGPTSWWAQLVSRLGQARGELRACVGAPLPIRFVVGVAMALAVSAIWWFLNHTTVVTATELLERAAAAQTQQILASSQPVIHQRLNVRRKRATQSETVQLETWHDLNNARFKQSSGQNSGQTDNAASTLTGELAKLFQANRMDWRRPLSAVSFAEWRKALHGKNDEVRWALIEGVEVLSLRTSSTEPPRGGLILEATLTVRARDWHSFKQVLRVKEDTGEVEYELSETAFEVVSLAAINPALFAESHAPKLATATPLVASSIVPTSVSPLPGSVPAPVTASVALEIETLALLAQAKADLGEHISVERTTQDALKIVGIVETAERKQELQRKLASVLASPAVRFEIETVEEALRRAKPASAVPPTVIEQRAITADTLPVEAELRRFLAERSPAAQLDGEAQRLARRTANASFRIRQHAQALHRLSNRFTPAQWQALDEAVRTRLLDLLASHASKVREQGQALRQSLQAIFKPSESLPIASGATEIADVPGLLRAISQLLELSATSDLAIQAAFTLSTDEAPAQAIKSPAFWHALAGLEQAAERIQAGLARLRKS
jgi:Putative zinc-finger